ncbi:hypothetical protein [Occallatibacter savannae]|uniref:hypothetical protein n=1 Tax=Occallatibacter savannae TaxID=1002691 RepID=UPI000D69A991|nr:hypothetical protein [Occallatibacter savannae]
MFRIACFCLVIGIAAPAWSQVEPSAYGGSYDLDSEHMQTPPPVSKGAYPSLSSSEERSNFISGGVSASGSYTDNLMLVGTKKVADYYYNVVPTISLDRRTPRHSESVHYGAGFRFYQNTTDFNAIDQDGSAEFTYRFTPYTALIITDTVTQNSNSYGGGNFLGSGGVSGAPGSTNQAFIEPYANRLNNATSAGLEYQFSKNAMIGASGMYSFLHFSADSLLPALSDQDTAGGNAFYSRRFGKSYGGLTYQFSKYITHPFPSYTVSNTVFGFFTHYFTRTVSVSVLGGPEHYTSWSQNNGKSGAWTPAAQGSVGWQVKRASLAANVVHIVSGAGGLVGTFHSDTGGGSVHMMVTPKWSAGAHVDYSRYKNLTTAPQLFQYFPGGTTIAGGIQAQRSLREWLALDAEYAHFHQNYGNVTNEVMQDTNQFIVGISCQFHKPLGR